MTTQKPTIEEDAAKHEAAKKPGRDDVHEQREEDQPREGVVTNTPPETKRSG